MAEPKELFTCLQSLVREQDLTLDDALRLFTSNPAHRLKLPHKGWVRVDRLAAHCAVTLTAVPLSSDAVQYSTIVLHARSKPHDDDYYREQPRLACVTQVWWLVP